MATSKDLARDVCEPLGLPPSVCKSSVADLGIDEPAGARRRGPHARLKQRGRFNLMRKRFRKVRALRRRFKGPKETPFRKVARQGVAPACSFGAG
eukprot:7647848-Pyramimonas_sp.AAC.1